MNAAVPFDLGTLNPKQEEFVMSRARFTAYGGARGGGKTHAVRVKALLGSMLYPGIRILIVRRTYPELEANHIQPIRKLVPPGAGTYNAQKRLLTMANGSTIRFGHFPDRAGAFREYQGQEYDWIFVDEATQFTEEEFRLLGSCLRGANDVPKQFFLTCNPGGVGHRWVKRLFIDRAYRGGGEEGEDPADYAFIRATVDDNTALLNSPDGAAYKKMLAALPESIRAAHRYGDWETPGGAFFPEFSRELHTAEPFAMPRRWRRYRALDYGLDMLAVLWAAADGEGRLVVYRELLAPGLTVSRAAEAIRERTLPGERIEATFAPPDLWSRQKDTGKSMAELFFAGGVPLLRTVNSRAQGWMQVREALLPGEDGKPGLTILRSCPGLIGDLGALRADESDPNDAAKTPHELTHSTDALRYLCVSRLLPGETEEPEPPEPDAERVEEPLGGEPPEEYLYAGGLW